MGVVAAACLPGLLPDVNDAPDGPRTTQVRQQALLRENGVIDTDVEEQCDPGTAQPVAGCTKDCKIDCTAPAGGGKFFDDGLSDH